MFEGYRVVVVTPAGRRRYMRLLVPQVMASPLVDRYDLWINTPDQGDLAFLRGVAEVDQRIRLVAHPDGEPPRIESIGCPIPIGRGRGWRGINRAKSPRGCGFVPRGALRRNRMRSTYCSIPDSPS